MAATCMFHSFNLFSSRQTVFDNRTCNVIPIKVYAEDTMTKKLTLRNDLSFELLRQSSLRKKISDFCFQEVNPYQRGVLIAYWNGKPAKIPAYSLRTTAAFVFDKGEDGRVIVQPIKESSSDISRFRMCACIGMRSDDGRLLPPIPFEENETERTSIAYNEPQTESEADETEGSISP